MANRVGQFWKVGLIIQLFLEQGCTLHEAEPTVMLNDGDCFNVRYLRHPTGPAFVALQDLVDDDEVATVEVRFWERRLGIDVLPNGKAH